MQISSASINQCIHHYTTSRHPTPWPAAAIHIIWQLLKNISPSLNFARTDLDPKAPIPGPVQKQSSTHVYSRTNKSTWKCIYKCLPMVDKWNVRENRPTDRYACPSVCLPLRSYVATNTMVFEIYLDIWWVHLLHLCRNNSIQYFPPHTSIHPSSTYACCVRAEEPGPVCHHKGNTFAVKYAGEDWGLRNKTRFMGLNVFLYK